jgi:hypothetical protein
MTNFRTAQAVTIRRTADGWIEYTVARPGLDVDDEPCMVDSVWHANRSATFYGPDQGGSSLRKQVTGKVRTIWRAEDAEMVEAARRAFPGADIKIVA